MMEKEARELLDTLERTYMSMMHKPDTVRPRIAAIQAALTSAADAGEERALSQPYIAQKIAEAREAGRRLYGAAILFLDENKSREELEMRSFREQAILLGILAPPKVEPVEAWVEQAAVESADALVDHLQTLRLNSGYMIPGRMELARMIEPHLAKHAPRHDAAKLADIAIAAYCGGDGRAWPENHAKATAALDAALKEPA